MTVTEPKSWQRVLEIEIPEKTVRERMDTAYRKYQQQATLPGFRKGKVPISLLKARFSNTVEQSVLQELIPQAWEEAREKNKIDPIAEPVVSDVQFKPGQPLKFKATVEIWPKIDLTGYTNLRATKRKATITREDEQNSLRALQERHATIAPSEGNVVETDIVLVDSWKVDKNGIPIVGQKNTDIPIDLSAPHVIKEYRQALVGAAVGDQRQVTVTYPQDHPHQELAGQQISFLLKVKEIKNKTLPPLDDEFAKAIGDFPNLKALREGIRKNLQEQEEQRARKEVEEQIIDQIIENNPFEMPESMVVGYIETLIADLHPNQKKDEEREQLRKTYRPLAVRSVKRWFIVEEVRKREGIRVEDKELKDRVTAMAADRKADPEQVYKQLAESNQLERLRHNMEEEKILHFLVGKTQVKTESVKSKS